MNSTNENIAASAELVQRDARRDERIARCVRELARIAREVFAPVLEQLADAFAPTERRARGPRSSLVEAPPPPSGGVDEVTQRRASAQLRARGLKDMSK